MDVLSTHLGKNPMEHNREQETSDGTVDTGAPMLRHSFQSTIDACIEMTIPSD